MNENEYRDLDIDQKKLRFLKHQVLQQEKDNVMIKNGDDEMVKNLRKLIEKVVNSN